MDFNQANRSVKANYHRIGFALLISFFGFGAIQAKEGMWIPTLLQAVEGDMQSMGMHITADDIYSINHGSLKDAIVDFNGGCTAEVISAEGLILTNHHCGYGEIAYHSTVENDYLTHGFWAMTRGAELPNPNLVATFIDRIEEVTDAVKASSDPESTKAELVAQATEGTNLEGRVVAFDFGNSFYLITTKTYRDVRLVGAPPSAVGKFGGDTDNWVWPRHTGDFSMFRIYANAENEPADYDESNQPYRPLHHFPVDIGGVKEGDFTMVFGFPGRTEQYLTSDAVEWVINSLNPARIDMREASLEVINAARARSSELRIHYADKQSSIANAWKKWIGQNKGLIELEAVDKKREMEAEFMKRAATEKDTEWMQLISKIQIIHADHFTNQLAHSLFIEWLYYGPDVLNFAQSFAPLIQNWDNLLASGQLESQLERAKVMTTEHFKRYDATVDQGILASLVAPYSEHIAPELMPTALVGAQADPYQWAADLFDKSIFDNQEDLEALLARGNQKSFTKLSKDPAFQLIQSMRSTYIEKVAAPYRNSTASLDSLSALFTSALAQLFPEKAFFPDANSTLRLTYGKVEGSAPYDGMKYLPFTTARGILQKYVPGDADFDLPLDLVAALQAGNWGPYANEDGELPVCFTGSNHTTGGNSGSPAIDGDGHLVGINFDRSWESTMSDILFDESRCRNIMVDIRYVLWVTDVYAGAGHLLDEMDLVR